jgi:hypothetical protein
MILQDYVQDEVKIPFNKYYEKYCGNFSATIKRTRDILSDIAYFDEHVKRTQKSNFVTYTVLPSNTRSISNNFVKEVGEAIIYSRKEDQCMIYVAIYEIMSAIFDEWYRKDSKAAEEYNEFFPVLEYFLNIKDDSFIDCFIGCSHGIGDLHSKLSKIRSKS